MYFSPLVPIPHLKELGYCRVSLVLSHLVGDCDNYYTEFYRKLSETGTYTILDNSAYESWQENKPLPTLEETLERAKLVKAHEIQFLEKFWDGEGTVQLVASWIDTMSKKELKTYSWHAIVQGKDHQDYVNCFNKLAKMEEVNVIGLPKVVTPHCYSEICGTMDLATTRIFAVAELINKTQKPIHLLGLEDPREVLIQRKWGNRIRSVDSSFPVVHAIHGISYSSEGAKYPTNLPRFDFFNKLNKETVERARHNIHVIKIRCGDL
jgi:queuine/archaeosine tRNA-ribosyltransferase